MRFDSRGFVESDCTASRGGAGTGAAVSARSGDAGPAVAGVEVRLGRAGPVVAGLRDAGFGVAAVAVTVSAPVGGPTRPRCIRRWRDVGGCGAAVGPLRGGSL